MILNAKQRRLSDSTLPLQHYLPILPLLSSWAPRSQVRLDLQHHHWWVRQIRKYPIACWQINRCRVEVVVGVEGEIRKEVGSRLRGSEVGKWISGILYNLMNCQIFVCGFLFPVTSSIYSLGKCPGAISLFVVSKSQHYYYHPHHRRRLVVASLVVQPKILFFHTSTHPLWRANNQFQVDCALHALTHQHKSTTHLVSDSRSSIASSSSTSSW